MSTGASLKPKMTGSKQAFRREGNFWLRPTSYIRVGAFATILGYMMPSSELSLPAEKSSLSSLYLIPRMTRTEKQKLLEKLSSLAGGNQYNK